MPTLSVQTQMSAAERERIIQEIYYPPARGDLSREFLIYVIVFLGVTAGVAVVACAWFWAMHL